MLSGDGRRDFIQHYFWMKQVPNVCWWCYPYIYIYIYGWCVTKKCFSKDTTPWFPRAVRANVGVEAEINLRSRECQGKECQQLTKRYLAPEGSKSKRFQIMHAGAVQKWFFPSPRVLLPCFTPRVKISLSKWTSHSTKSHDLNPWS